MPTFLRFCFLCLHSRQRTNDHALEEGLQTVCQAGRQATQLSRVTAEKVCYCLLSIFILAKHMSTTVTQALIYIYWNTAVASIHSMQNTNIRLFNGIKDDKNRCIPPYTYPPLSLFFLRISQKNSDSDSDQNHTIHLLRESVRQCVIGYAVGSQ